MAKFLRILPAQQTTSTNGPILLDPESILVMTAGSDTTVTLLTNTIDAGSETATVTFSSADASYAAHRNFCDAMCAAASDQKSSIYDLPPIIGGDGLVRTINSIVYA
jgi:hypothetical protein